MASRVHVIGAGIAGLSAAVRLAAAGMPVTLHEAAGHAGGRCRSFDDPRLGRRIDNGNHLLLSGNRSAMAYLGLIGGMEGLTGPERAAFPFIDLATGERWKVVPGRSAIPWWILSKRRRIPGTRIRDYLSGIALARAGAGATVAGAVDPGSPLFRRFWEPLTVAALNTAPEEAAAALLWPVLRETFGRGEAACRPRIARLGLSETLVDPALAFLRRTGAEVLFGARLGRFGFERGRISALHFADRDLALPGGEAVVLAVPPLVAAGLVPGLAVPRESRAIVNVHFRLPAAPEVENPIGVVGGISHWIFVRGDIVSVTVSAADSLAEEPAEAIASRIFREVATVLGLPPGPEPPARVIKERRATFAQTPAAAGIRPGTTTGWPNLFLAGDWTATGLPATIEGAILSGERAAAAALTAPEFPLESPSSSRN